MINDLLTMFNLSLHTQGERNNRWISLHNFESIDSFSYSTLGGMLDSPGLSSPLWSYKSGMYVFLNGTSRVGRCNIYYTKGNTTRTRYSTEIAEDSTTIDPFQSGC